jgi:hypothetical protein
LADKYTDFTKINQLVTVIMMSIPESGDGHTLLANGKILLRKTNKQRRKIKNNYLHLVSRLRMYGAILPLPHVVMVWCLVKQWICLHGQLYLYSPQVEYHCDPEPYENSFSFFQTST